MGNQGGGKWGVSRYKLSPLPLGKGCIFCFIGELAIMLNNLARKKITFMGLIFRKPSQKQIEERAAFAKAEHDKLIESALRVL